MPSWRHMGRVFNGIANTSTNRRATSVAGLAFTLLGTRLDREGWTRTGITTSLRWLRELALGVARSCAGFVEKVGSGAGRVVQELWSGCRGCGCCTVLISSVSLSVPLAWNLGSVSTCSRAMEVRARD